MYWLIVIFIIILPQEGFAYIGPGAGVGVILSSLIFVLSLFLLIFGFIWFGIKKIFTKYRNKKNNLNNLKDKTR